MRTRQMAHRAYTTKRSVHSFRPRTEVYNAAASSQAVPFPKKQKSYTARLTVPSSPVKRSLRPWRKLNNNSPVTSLFSFPKTNKTLRRCQNPRLSVEIMALEVVQTRHFRLNRRFLIPQVYEMRKPAHHNQAIISFLRESSK